MRKATTVKWQENWGASNIKRPTVAVPQATLDHPKLVRAFPVLGSSCDIEMGRLHAAFEAF